MGGKTSCLRMPIKCMLKHFQKDNLDQDDYGIHFSRKTLYPESRDSEILQAVRAVWSTVTGSPSHPDQFLYANSWLTLAIHPFPWLKTRVLSLGVRVLLVQPEHLKRLKNVTGFALSEEIEIPSLYILTGLTEYIRGARGNGHPPPPFMAYVSFIISDLCNWKTPKTLIFSEKPQALIILLETISYIHQSIWDDWCPWPPCLKPRCKTKSGWEVGSWLWDWAAKHFLMQRTE